MVPHSPHNEYHDDPEEIAGNPGRESTHRHDEATDFGADPTKRISQDHGIEGCDTEGCGSGVSPVIHQRPEARTSGGLGLAAAIRFLLPVGRGPSGVDAEAIGRAAVWIVPIGLAIGLLWVGAFRMTWRLYGETANMRVVPALTVVLMECLLTGPFLVLGLARTLHLLTGDRPLKAGPDPMAALSPAGTLFLILTVFSLWVLIVSIRDRAGWWPSESDPRHYFNFLYPRPIFRPLLLAPIWGRWGILLAVTIGRTAHHADQATIALVQAMSPGRLLRQALLPMILTSVYFSREHNRLLGVIMAMMVFGIAFLISVIMARRGGGQTRQSVFASGMIAQLAFLAIYRAFWPLIHG